MSNSTFQDLVKSKLGDKSPEAFLAEKKSKFSVKTLGRYLTGESNPNSRTMAKVAKLLEMDGTELAKIVAESKPARSNKRTKRGPKAKRAVKRGRKASGDSSISGQFDAVKTIGDALAAFPKEKQREILDMVAKIID